MMKQGIILVQIMGLNLLMERLGRLESLMEVIIWIWEILNLILMMKQL